LGLLGCASPDSARWSYVEPADGQAEVSRREPVRVAGLLAGLPPRFELPPRLLQVVDVTSGGLVPGRLGQDGLDLLFSPTDTWAGQTTYHWRIEELALPPRGPAWSVEPRLASDLQFSTGSAPPVLDVLLDPQEGLCVVLAAPYQGEAVLAQGADEAASADWELVLEIERIELPGLRGPSLEALCEPGLGSEGAPLTLTWEGEVVWTGELSAGSLQGTFSTRRRRVERAP
jgi:hypothetical protein